MTKYMIVININLKKPLLYKREIKDDEDVLMDVESFFEEHDIRVSTDTVDRISMELEKKLYSWYSKNICFILIKG